MHQRVKFSESPARYLTDRLEIAILKTVLYSDLFDYPLTPDEIAHYLLEVRHSKEQLQAILRDPERLPGPVTVVDNHIALRGREGLVARRRDRILNSNRIWRRARLYSRLLGILPFVRMVAVTGALAMDNSDENDDVDVLIVTAPERVWLARAFAVLVVRACKLIPNTLCPNYVISQEMLSLERRTVYTAHEVIQMVPIYGHEVYARMRAANGWVRSILPNADGPLHREPEYKPGPVMRTLKKILERWLAGALGDWIESWEMRRKILKFEAINKGASGGAVFDHCQVKGHFIDHGARISSEYRDLLNKYRLTSSEEG